MKKNTLTGKLRVKKMFTIPATCNFPFLFIKMLITLKVLYFFKMYYCTLVQDTTVREADVVSISQVLPTAILSLLILGD